MVQSLSQSHPWYSHYHNHGTVTVTTTVAFRTADTAIGRIAHVLGLLPRLRVPLQLRLQSGYPSVSGRIMRRGHVPLTSLVGSSAGAPGSPGIRVRVRVRGTELGRGQGYEG